MCKASGSGSHAGGNLSEAAKNYSFAFGDSVYASRIGQTTVGTFNKLNNNALFIVGNGTGPQERSSNAFEVLSDGTAKIGGTPAPETVTLRNIYAGTTDMTAGTTALATGAIYFVYE